MTHARIISRAQEHWRHDVVAVTSNGSYLTLHCANHPMEQHFWRGANDTSVLLCATDEDVVAALRGEIAVHRAVWEARS